MSDKQQGLRNIYGAIDKAGSSDSQIHISEAEVMEVRKSDKKVRLTLLPDERDIGWVRLYMVGLNDNWSTGLLPTVGNTVVVLFPRGQMDTGICLSGGMSEGSELGSALESELDLTVHDSRGNKITLTATGITIECDMLTVNNGIKPVARIGDKVASPFGPLLIIEGNNNFLA